MKSYCCASASHSDRLTSVIDVQTLRVISKSALRDFWESRKNDSVIAERSLSAWYKLAKDADWSNFAEMKQVFGSADQVGDCVVFDVGNNRFRLIGRVRYQSGKIYILKVMDHQEYDENRWRDECGCHRAPPKKNRGGRNVKR
jgi:mRNA interferase HigB